NLGQWKVTALPAKLSYHPGSEISEGACSARHDFAADGVSVIREFGHQRKCGGKNVIGVFRKSLGETIPARPLMQIEQTLGKRGGWTSILCRERNGAHSLAPDIESTALVTDPRTAASSSRCATPRVPAKGHRTGSCE